MKIIFLLRTSVIEWDVPQDKVSGFNFIQRVVQVRLDGYFMDHNIYIRHDEMLGMAFFDGAVGPTLRPTGSTVQ